jgi:hypothetical protein
VVTEAVIIFNPQQQTNMPRFILFFANVCLLFSSGMSSISRQECQDQGGQVVGDIGDGAIFGADYICENNGLPPTDPVMASSGEPIAIEGEVCCGGTGEGIAFMSDGLGNQNETAIPVNTTDRDVYSRQECLDNGGAVVGDIGDGSIFQPDYICEISGQPPVADIVQTEEPFALEGEVCCGQETVPNSKSGTIADCSGDSASSSPFVSLGFFSALLVWNIAYR